MYANTLNRYLSLPSKDNKLQALYIWIGGSGELRSKTKTIMHDGKTTTRLHNYQSRIMMEVVLVKQRVN